MTGKDINKRLVNRIDEVVTKIIFPYGKRISKEWCVGDLTGDPGESLKVVVEGSKAGVWKDWATDDTGDLIELWCRAKCDGDMGKAMAEIREFLGLPSYRSDSKFQSTESNSFAKPKEDWGRLSKQAGEYLVKRGISKTTIIEAGIKGFTDNNNNKYYVFLSYDHIGENRHKQASLAKYVRIKRSESGKKKEWTSKGSKSILWGMCLPVPKGHDKLSVIITEGEIDALSYREQGHFAVSVPFGASNHQWVEHCYDWLSQFQTIYLSFDSDLAGREGCKKLADRLGRDRIKEIIFPEGRDANDELRSDNSLAKYIEEAKEIPNERLVSSDQLLIRTIEYISKGRPELQGIPLLGWDGKEDTVNFKLRPSEMTLWTGYPHSGKSTLLYQQIAYLALIHNEPSAIASTEVDPEQIIYTMACQSYGGYLDPTEQEDLDIIKAIAKELLKYVYVFDFKGIAVASEIMEFFDYCCKVKGARNCILDSITNSDIDLENHSQVTDFLSSMIGAMHYTKAHFSLVAHVRKGNMQSVSEIPKFDAVKGTNSFGALAFNCLTIWRNTPKEEALASAIRKGDREREMELSQDWGDTKLVVSKQKIGGQTGEYNLWYDPDSYSFARSNRGHKRIFQLTEEDEIEQPF